MVPSGGYGIHWSAGIFLSFLDTPASAAVCHRDRQTATSLTFAVIDHSVSGPWRITFGAKIIRVSLSVLWQCACPAYSATCGPLLAHLSRRHSGRVCLRCLTF